MNGIENVKLLSTHCVYCQRLNPAQTQILKPLPLHKKPITLTTEKLFLFTDGSVNTKSDIGYGASWTVRRINNK